MKTMKMILLAFVLLATACSQNTTTPPATTNPCGATTNSNEFIELKINGLNLRSESFNINNGLGGVIIFPVMATFVTDTSSPGERRLNLLCSTTFCPNNNSIMLNNLAMTVFASNRSSNYINPIGVYNKAAYGSISYYKSLNDVKGYTIPDDSITVTVTSCTADYVSGTFVGHALENNTNILYPFNGTFNNLKRSGF
jgi:hypothetical protein